MRLLKHVALWLALSGPAIAADNVTVKDAGGNPVVLSTKQQADGSQSYKNVIISSAGNEPLGDPVASPASNTVLDRLKSLQTAITTLNTTMSSVVTALQAGVTQNCAVTSAEPSYTSGTSQACSLQINGRERVSTGSQGAAAASVPGYVEQMGGKDGTGKLQPAAVSPTGVFASPNVGACDAAATNGCKETHTNVALNTPTVVCPAVSSGRISATMIYFTTGGVGVSLSGSTSLSSASVNATSLSTSPTFTVADAGTLWTSTLPFTSQITVYGAAGYVSCVQYFWQ